MIKVQNLSKTFNTTTVVNQVSFEVQSGEVLGFLGPNGAGKSTTMRMISGFLTPTTGSVQIFDHDILSDAIQAKKLIGYLPEGAPLYADMSPLQFLSFIASMRGFHGEEKEQRIASVVKQLSLQRVLNQPIDTLSKGFKRRVGIAQAIIHDPKVLILDEPTDGLDPNQKHQVRDLIRNLSKEKIVIISTHILEEVDAVCSRAIIIANGRIVSDETPDELCQRSKYHHAITLQLKESGNVLTDLNGINGVANIESNNSVQNSYTLFPEKNVNLLTAVNEMIQQKGWNVDALYVERGRLDDVFREITANNKEAA